MSTKIDVLTLGVSDIQRARRFYEAGLGGVVGKERHGLVVSLGAHASRVVLRDWNAVASDAGVETGSTGFRAFTLSYIVDSADAVDEVLTRAQRHGGAVTKPPKNAVWGYSAYVTDPDGYLWKVASSKRRPLIGRKEAAAGNGLVVKPKEIPITIGVADMKRSKEFYKDGLGLPVKKAFGSKFVMFAGDDGSSDLGMYKREALADDAAVQPEGRGFRGFSLTHFVEGPDEVDTVLAAAERSGGQIVKPAARSQEGYSGYFGDLDGNLWQVATGN